MSDKREAEDFDHFLIHFDSTSSYSPLAWIQVGEVALKDAVAELSVNGTTLTEQRVEDPNQDTSRGLGYDLLIGIASNVATTLLIDFFAMLIANVFTRYPRPEWVTLESEANESDTDVAFRADEGSETIRAKIQVWLLRAEVLKHRLIIRIH